MGETIHLQKHHIVDIFVDISLHWFSMFAFQWQFRRWTIFWQCFNFCILLFNTLKTFSFCTLCSNYYIKYITYKVCLFEKNAALYVFTFRLFLFVNFRTIWENLVLNTLYGSDRAQKWLVIVKWLIFLIARTNLRSIKYQEVCPPAMC